MRSAVYVMNKIGPRTEPCGTRKHSRPAERKMIWVSHGERTGNDQKGKTETTLKLAHVAQRTAPADGTKHYGRQYRMHRIDQGEREQQRPRCPLPQEDRPNRAKRLFLWSYSNGIQTAAMATGSIDASMRYKLPRNESFKKLWHHRKIWDWAVRLNVCGIQPSLLDNRCNKSFFKWRRNMASSHRTVE